MKFKTISKFGSKMHLAPSKAPKIAQLGLLAQRKILFPANREGGRALRFLGLSQAATRLDDQNVGFPPDTPCAFLKARDAFWSVPRPRLGIHFSYSLVVLVEWVKVRIESGLGKCRDPGSNRGPSDLRSDPTELSRPWGPGYGDR
jgi:hypothetical protein